MAAAACDSYYLPDVGSAGGGNASSSSLALPPEEQQVKRSTSNSVGPEWGAEFINKFFPHSVDDHNEAEGDAICTTPAYTRPDTAVFGTPRRCDSTGFDAAAAALPYGAAAAHTPSPEYTPLPETLNAAALPPTVLTALPTFGTSNPSALPPRVLEAPVSSPQTTHPSAGSHAAVAQQRQHQQLLQRQQHQQQLLQQQQSPAGECLMAPPSPYGGGQQQTVAMSPIITSCNPNAATTGGGVDTRSSSTLPVFRPPHYATYHPDWSHVYVMPPVRKNTAKISKKKAFCC